MQRLLLPIALGALATPVPAMAAVYLDQASFRAAQPNATAHAFAFTRPVEVDAPYTTAGVTFSATDMLGYNDKGYGTKQAYLETLYGETQTVTYTGTAIGLVLGSYFEADTIGYTVNGLSGTINLAGRPKNGCLGLTQAVASPITVTLTQPASYENLDILGFYTAVAATGPSVPEPASWAMMIIGFLIVGSSLRRRGQFPEYSAPRERQPIAGVRREVIGHANKRCGSDRRTASG